MEQKEFIEVATTDRMILISVSSIAMVEPTETGATIVMKEINKNNVSYVIQTSTLYSYIKSQIAP